MRLKHFTLPLAYLSLLLLLLGYLSVPAAAQPITRTFHLRNSNQLIEVRHADGSISRAEFAAEMILYPDGRANGGWGLREFGTAPALTLYRVVEGQVDSDNIFTFTAVRLWPLPADEITISLQLSPAGGALPPPGSVKFVDFTVDGTLSFVAQGQVLQPPTIPSVTDLILDRCIYINAPPQTVVVQTPNGSYTAYFTNVALIFPSGGAIGTLELSEPSGEQMQFDAFYGRGVYKSTDSGTTWSLIMQRARATNAKPTPSGSHFIVVFDRPVDPASEPWGNYDIAGSQVGTLHFEAQASVTIF
jgi:hypothetical protein